MSVWFAENHMTWLNRMETALLAQCDPVFAGSCAGHGENIGKSRLNAGAAKSIAKRS